MIGMDQMAQTDVSSFVSAIGSIAAAKKPKRVAPGGVQGGTPAPMKIRSDNGVTDSDFIRQIIAAAQAQQQDPMAAMQMGNNTGMPQDMSTGAPPMQQPQPQQQSPQEGIAGLAQMFQQLGAGGGQQ